MADFNEKTLRWFIAVLFALLVLLPLFFVGNNVTQLLERRYNENMALARDRLVDEMKLFKESLVPRLYVEKIIKTAEKSIGITSETSEKTRFAQNVDPQIITAASNAQFRQLYKEIAGLEPLFLLSFGVDCQQIWSWYNTPLAHLAIEERNGIDAVCSIFLANMASPQAVMNNQPDALNNFEKAWKITNSINTGFSDAIQKTLYQYFSDLAYVPRVQGICYEMGCRDFASRYLYCYYRSITDGPYIYGGYFVMFASAQLRVANIVRDSLLPSQPLTLRSMLEKSPYPVNRLLHSDHEIRLVSNLPTELAAFNRRSGEKYPLSRYLAVSVSIKEIRREYERYLQKIAAIYRMATLAVFMLAVYFILFGLPLFMRLRLRILAVLALVLLMPYSLLGFFCFSLLDSSEKLAGYELKAEADTMLYRLRNYYLDQKQQFSLHTLKSKDRLSRIMSMSAEKIENLPPELIVNAGSDVNLSFYRNDGVSRLFKDDDDFRKKVPKVDKMVAIKHLDNLGVLKKDTPEIRDLLNQIMLADGFMDTMRRDYYEHGILQHEAVETLELRKIDNLSHMIYYLIPDAGDPAMRVCAQAIISVANSGNMLVDPRSFSPKIYSESTKIARHNFAVGLRRIDDSIFNWWPGYINPNSPLKHLLENAASSRSSGFRAKPGPGGGVVEKYHFENDLDLVFSSVSHGFPDFLMQLLVVVFPILLLAVVLISLFLFADILAVLFIIPVKGFQKAAGQIGAGNWQTRVEIAKTDEFALLADSFNRMAVGLEQREKMRRFVSEDLYQQLGQRTLSEEPRLTRVSLLASDIRGFTSLSEKVDPQEIVSLLNDYFTEMEAAITACGGFVERLVGDAVVAVFYESEEVCCEQQAVRAAWRMRARLNVLNQRRAALEQFTVDNGIGIASGQVFSGAAGSESGRRVFSVIGEVTQRAERIESLTRTVTSRILLCPETVKKLDARCQVAALDSDSELTVFTLIDCEDSDGEQ